MENGSQMNVKSDLDIYCFNKEDAVNVLMRDQPDKSNLNRFIGKMISFFCIKINMEYFNKDTEYNMDGFSILYNVYPFISGNNPSDKSKFWVEGNTLNELEYTYDLNTEILKIIKIALAE
jgi:hypothetical protein